MRSGPTARSVASYQEEERANRERERQEDKDKETRARLARCTLPRSVRNGLNRVTRCSGCGKPISANKGLCKACSGKV